MSSLLQVEALEAWYGRAQALFGLRFAVGTGEVLALLGRNGAGKSTTLKALMGLVARRGEVRLEGHALGQAAPHAICRAGLAYVPEERRIFTDLSVRENLELAQRPARPGLPGWDLARVLDRLPALAPLLARRGGQVSGGEQQLLALARGLLANPRVLLLDEPCEGMAPQWIEQVSALVAEVKGDGMAVLLSEQNLALAAAVSDRALVLERGETRHQGAMREVVEDAVLRAELLGV